MDHATGRGESPLGTARDPGRRVSHPALTDPLTSLPNRLHFDTVFEVVFEMGDRGIPLTLVHFEIDGIDELERGRGPDPAREAIRHFGTTLGRATRRMDLFSRVGGGRFVALFQDCNLQGGLVATHRMGDMLAEWAAETGLTFSAGVAAWRPEMTEPADLWEKAERALDEARKGGGGRVEVPPPY